MSRDRFPRVPVRVTEAQLPGVAALLGADDGGAWVEVTDGPSPGWRRWTGTAFVAVAGGTSAPAPTLITAAEALSAGDLVAVLPEGARRASAAQLGREAAGFVLQAAASGAQAAVFFQGVNTAVTGQTPGPAFLDPYAPGRTTSTPPTAAGHLLQPVGWASSATSLVFQPGRSTML
ncbi:hypothetical protein [Deinococcus budaensis]|uniref:Uncharacterized protein n=1 Tax=Deinococcus budaensis TaxID=1665626 RepID=A0A7W8GF46_9DEIO|nr:hypothetical protein [Deinococcus budaensis]MBB5234497.1 hypothetical protein [Deinococcus budaensis]